MVQKRKAIHSLLVGLLLMTGCLLHPAIAQIPAELMANCKQWKITYPTGEEDKTLCDEPNNEFFYVNDTGNAIVFRTPIRNDNGTTPNSSFIRSELREREADGSRDIFWTTEGTHVIYVKQAITHLPIIKSHLVATQIHGNKDEGIDDAMVLRLEDKHLFLSFNGRVLRDHLTITRDYLLGTVHEVIFIVVDGKHYCYYSDDGRLLSAYNSGDASDYLIRDGENDYVMDLNYGDAYFRVGNYTQSNAEREGSAAGDANNYGEVLVYDFFATHEDKIVAVTGVSLSPDTLALSIGASVQLDGDVIPSFATNNGMTYLSSDDSVVEVNESGEVTGLSPGTATITVTTDDGQYTATSHIRVIPDAEGPNLALEKLSTGTGVHDGDNDISNLVDGLTSTRWSVSGFPQTAIIDLGEVYSLGRTEVVCYEDRAYQYSISVSDTEEGIYTELVDRSQNNAPGTASNPIVDIFPAAQGRYIKLSVTGADSYDGPWVSLTEFRAFEALATSIEDDFMQKYDIELWPNPVNNTLHFSGAEELDVLTVFDLQGKQMMSQPTTDNTVDMSNFAAGVYLIRFSNKSQTLQYRITKQ